MDDVEVNGSDITDTIITIRCRNKMKLDKNTIAYFLCKSYPDCNVTTIRQGIVQLYPIIHIGYHHLNRELLG